MNTPKPTTLTLQDMELTISTFLEDCKQIRADRQKDYGFHFMDNYNKYGLKGFLINDGEITARLEQIDEKIGKINSVGGPIKVYGYSDAEKRLKNALYDGINYRLLLLFWLDREKWGAHGGYVSNPGMCNVTNNHCGCVSTVAETSGDRGNTHLPMPRFDIKEDEKIYYGYVDQEIAVSVDITGKDFRLSKNSMDRLVSLVKEELIKGGYR